LLALSPLVPSLHGVQGAWAGLQMALVGLALGSGILWLVGMLGKLAFKKDAMGLGDVKLLGGLGALLGWRAVIFIMMVSSLLGSIVGVGMIVSKHKEWQSRVPYGPYLAVAAVVWILGGFRWWAAYFAWLQSPV
ncbi:MAG: A24 family peptidase, partial [Verrucomicrobia bacterium]|nr:A24 family peptidase [Verrucomicrobiota bacterium]